MWPFRRRRKEQPQPIGEAEAYERSYGERTQDVRTFKLPPRRPRDKEVLKSGEVMRRAFLDRLEQRQRGGQQKDSEG
jgi:hypothetical protein